MARAAQLIRVLAESPSSLTLSEIAARCQLPMPTTHRLLNLLQDQGFAERGAKDRTYTVGYDLMRLSALVSSRSELTELARDVMQAVVSAVDETCLLSLYNRREQRTMLAKVLHGAKPLRYDTPTFEARPLAWGATSRAILAFLPGAVIDEVLAHTRPSPTTGETWSKEANKTDLARIRERGYAISRGQMLTGAIGMGAPVFRHGEVVAALCLTIPDGRFDPAQETSFAKVLVDQAKRLSALLG